MTETNRIGQFTHEKVAWYSSMLLLLSVDLLFYFSLTGEIDLFYSFLSYTSMISIHYAWKKQKPGVLFTLPYFLAGLGFLTKGIPSIVFVAATFAALAMAERNWKILLHPGHLLGLLIFLASISWYFYLYQQEGDALHYLQCIIGQASNRFVDTRPDTMANGHNWLKWLQHFGSFPFEVWVALLPTSLAILLLFLKRARQERLFQTQILKNPFFLFCLLAFGLNFIVYWISSGARLRYTYMLFPFASLLFTAIWWQSRQWVPKLEKGVQIVLVLLIAGRIVFDLTVLPIRAKSGQIAHYQEIARNILEITKNDKLHLFKYKNGASFPMTTAWIIEKERREELAIRYEENCDDYFIAWEWDFRKGTNFDIFYSYEYYGRKYYLVKFNHCKD
jgi:4-amino-4-deoxy-L-arabinose transferase-like glycosyltransferase